MVCSYGCTERRLCGTICAMPTSKRRKSRDKSKPETKDLDLRGLRFTALGLMAVKQVRDEKKADPK